MPELDGCTSDAATCTVGKPMCGFQAMPMARRGERQAAVPWHGRDKAVGAPSSEVVVEHEQGLDSRFVTGGIRQAIYLAERAAYRRSGRRSSPQGRSPAGRSVDLIANPPPASTGRYVPPEGLALRPNGVQSMCVHIVCRCAHRSGTHGRRVQLAVVRAGTCASRPKRTRAG